MLSVSFSLSFRRHADFFIKEIFSTHALFLEAIGAKVRISNSYSAKIIFMAVGDKTLHISCWIFKGNLPAAV